MATALLAGEKLRELILPGSQDDKAGALAALLLQLKLELPFDRVVTIGTVLVPILLVTLVFTKNFAGEAGRASAGVERPALRARQAASSAGPHPPGQALRHCPRVSSQTLGTTSVWHEGLRQGRLRALLCFIVVWPSIPSASSREESRPDLHLLALGMNGM